MVVTTPAGRRARHDPPVPAELLERLAQLPAARPLLERLVDSDGVYLVGGGVRDLLLGGAPLDLDLVVAGDPAPVAARLGPPVRAHDRFDTCTVLLDGFRYDLARARQETYGRPGALPTVAPAGIEEDLRRRDFTVNAVALGLGGGDRGRLLAVPDALEDLGARRLRVLHDSSFVDDPTRLLRLARYAARLGFEVEAATARLAAAAVAGGALGTVSGNRVGAELQLAADEPDPVAALRRLHALGVDEAIEPGLGIGDDGAAEAAERALALLDGDGDRGAVALAAAARGVAAGRLGPLLDRLSIPARRRDAITAAATQAPRLARALEAAPTPSRIAAAAGGMPAEAVALAGALGAAGAASAARRWLSELRHVRLEIRGQDLLDAGVDPGPEIGERLRRALAAKLDGRAEDRAGELAAALRG